jgi:hypothetical protein
MKYGIQETATSPNIAATHLGPEKAREGPVRVSRTLSLSFEHFNLRELRNQQALAGLAHKNL